MYDWILSVASELAEERCGNLKLKSIAVNKENK